MVIRAKDREPDQIIQDYLSAKARTDILGAGFQPTENQLNELRNIINIFGEYSLSRSRNNKGLSKKTLERVIPRFLKNNLTGFVDRLQQMEELPSKNCQEYFILAYGAAEAKIFQDEKAKKCSRSEESVGKEKWEEWIHNRSGSFLDRWTAEHGIDAPKVEVNVPNTPQVNVSGPSVAIPGFDWMLGDAAPVSPAPIAILSVVNNSVTLAPKNAGIISKYTVTAINATPEKVEEAINNAITSGVFTQSLKNAGFPNAAATQKVTIQDRTPPPTQNPLKKTVVEITQVCNVIIGN